MVNVDTNVTRKRREVSPTPHAPALTKLAPATPLARRRLGSNKVKLEHAAPPTPESLPRKPRRRREVVIELPQTPTRTQTSETVGTVVAEDETGHVEPVDKIHLIQERVRHDPWRMLVATSLLNVTSGRAARPVFWELLRRWPRPEALAEASIPDLTALLYPLGLFNQRASSLVRFSRQYLDLGWPDVSASHTLQSPSLLPSLPYSEPLVVPSDPKTEEPRPPDKLDVRIFVGAGTYASDSFRIYSDLLPGKGAPEKEGRWLEKRKRAMERMAVVGLEGIGVEEVGGYLSDEEGDNGGDEWRKVLANDKELRRYLIWRWGLEGIVYDIHRGPQIVRERDKRRLGVLSADETDSDLSA